MIGPKTTALLPLCLALACAAQSQAQTPRAAARPGPAAPAAPALTVLPVRGDIYMIVGGGEANTIVQVGKSGVVVIDPKGPPLTNALIAEIRKLSDEPVRLVIDTSGDADHVAGNGPVARSGQTLQGGNMRPAAVENTGAPIWAHEGVLPRLAESTTIVSPSDSYFVAQKDMFMNGEAVQLLHVPAGHSNGDTMVMFRKSDVIASGDIYTPDRYPMVDLANGGSINGLIDGLNHLLRLTVPEFNQQGGTMVIPGHGRLSDESDVSEYRDMATIVRDRVKDMIENKRMTLAQVQAAKPTFDYDGLYGGAAKGAAFVEQVYRSLSQSARTAQGGQP